MAWFTLLKEAQAFFDTLLLSHVDHNPMVDTKAEDTPGPGAYNFKEI